MVRGERRRDVERGWVPDSFAGQLPSHPSLIILVSIELIAIHCSIGPAFSSSYGSPSFHRCPSFASLLAASLDTLREPLTEEEVAKVLRGSRMCMRHSDVDHWTMKEISG